jgi:hypothetical protein
MSTVPQPVSRVHSNPRSVREVSSPTLPRGGEDDAALRISAARCLGRPDSELPDVTDSAGDDYDARLGTIADDEAWWLAYLAGEVDEAPEDLVTLEGEPESLGTPAEVLYAEASQYASRDTAAGWYLAAEIRQLAALAQSLEAATFPALAALIEMKRIRGERDIWNDGWNAGLRQGRRD